ncbi:YbhB/YbcL family Raf kinase inhibitor-like protein [Lewinellaceae bacterium SD302]|nr:YbhB/YbcL family Raf kinase inhibitor-like protein [Lewinellaceae bacterium SD302]
MAGFTLTSTQFSGQISKACVFNGMGAGGDNQSPDLSWSGAPAGTKSYVLILHDPDAPTPAGFTHWCVFNIPASCSRLDSGASNNAMPSGSVEVTNSYGMPGYGGACPPPGDLAHAYHFTLYALDTEKLELDASTPPPKVIFMAKDHVIGKTGLTAFYAR